MIICIDVGNTNIKYAIFDGSELKFSYRVATDLKRTSDEYGSQLVGMLEFNGLSSRDITGGIISSVVPSLDYTIEHMLKMYLKIDPLQLAPGLKSGLKMHVDNAREVGADRIVNNVSALHKYGKGKPMIVIDFGTATTFGAIDRQGAFAGGCICPGLKLTSEALVTGTAKLPRFELVKPDHVIGRTTVTNLQAGVIYGYIGQVDYLVQRFRKELGAPDALVVATGGMARLVAEEDGTIDKLDGILTLKGLRLIYERNR